MDDTISVPSPVFGARAAGVVLLALFLLLNVLSPTLRTIVEYLRNIQGAFALDGIPDLEAKGITRAVEGIVKPWLILGTTFLILKVYFKNESWASLAARFGLEWSPPLRISIVSFLLGVMTLGVFSKVLFQMFPPETPPVSHPVNVIANAAFLLQLAYALTSSTMVPIAEEFVFRGTLYNGFASTWGKPLSALLVTLVFIFVHPEVWQSGYWVSHLCLCVVSAMLMIARQVTGALSSSIMIHSGVNFAEMFVF